jgi:hypothetical protein
MDEPLAYALLPDLDASHARGTKGDMERVISRFAHL